MTTTDAPTGVLSEYPHPLPHGTRVRSTGHSSISSIPGELGTVVGNDHPDVAQDWTEGEHKGGLFVKWDNHDKVNYLAGPGYNKHTVGQYVEVISIPETPLYVGVSHKHTPEAKGIVVSRYGENNECAVVMRTGIHLTTGTQDWGAEWTIDQDPPVYETDYGLLNLGARVIFTAPYAGMRGTVVGHEDGTTFFFVDPGQDFDTKPAWSDPDNMDQDTMFSPSSCGWHRIGEQVGIDKVGNPLHVGDRVIYDNDVHGGEWSNVTGTILKKGTAGALLMLRLDATHLDGSPLTATQQNYTGPTASPCELGPDNMTRLKDQPSPTVAEEKIDTGFKSKLGQTIYVGDTLEYIPGSPTWAGAVLRALDPATGSKRYEFVTVPANLSGSYSVGSGVNLTPGDLVHVVETAEVPHALGEKFRYADGVPIARADRIVADPGTALAGRSGTVLGLGLTGTDKVLIELHDGDQVELPVGGFSRLQDEDKEKLADEFQPTPVLTKLQEVLDRVLVLKDEVTERLEQVESELTDAEQNQPDVSVSFDSDSLTGAVSISTSNSELLGYIEYDGDGGLTIDDAKVDEHAKDCASIDASAVDYNVSGLSMETHLADLHAALATGQAKLDALLSTVDEATAMVGELLGDQQFALWVEDKTVPVKERQTFEGIIHNARIGVTLPEDTDTGPALRLDVIAGPIANDDAAESTRRVRLVGAQIGKFLTTVAVSDVKHLDGRKAILVEDSFGGWYPTAVGEVPEV